MGLSYVFGVFECFIIHGLVFRCLWPQITLLSKIYRQLYAVLYGQDQDARYSLSEKVGFTHLGTYALS